MPDKTEQTAAMPKAPDPVTMKARHFTLAENAVSAAQSLMAEAILLGGSGLLRESIRPAIDAMSCLERATNYLREHCLQVREFEQRTTPAPSETPADE